MEKSKKPLVLILCGGKSLRLWPLSQYKSKNFLDIFGFSPLELTIKRFLKITDSKNIFLVANHQERSLLRKIKLIKKENIFFEPKSKNTAAAILFSLKKLKDFPNRNLIISPVDHLIKKEKPYYKALRKAQGVASQGFICTIGIKPITANKNFGYIQVNRNQARGAYPVKKFIEKPAISKIKKLILQGDSFYNSGIFIASVKTFLVEFEKYYSFYRNFDTCLTKKNISTIYNRIADIPFDKAIMEKTKKARMIEAKFFWRDFGSWHTIYDILPKCQHGNASRGKSFVYNGRNNLVYLDNPKKKVLVMGLEDVFFIDTKDYTILSDRNHLNELKFALKEFKIVK